jgi:GNAT superfamily N-acetyltransferase
MFRQAIRADLAAAAEVLASAFDGDPWFRWLYPEPGLWPREPARWFGLVLDRAFAMGHVHVGDGTAAVWIPPDVHFPGSADVDAAVALLSSQIGERARAALGVIGGAGAAFADRPPRWHCVYVGVVPAQQGRGQGRTLLRRVLDQADRDRLPASLTSTNDVNLPFYRTLGFAEIGAVAIPGGERALRPMWRDPR